MNKRKYGEKTRYIGRKLSDKLESYGYAVFYDLKKPDEGEVKNVGTIATWFGVSYGQKTRLGWIDIAIVENVTDNIKLLIEIEESNSNPKVIIGDVFATLLGDHITFKGKKSLKIGGFTTFLVLIKGDEKQLSEKISYLEKQALSLLPIIKSRNSSIGDLQIRTYTDEKDLYDQIIEFIEIPDIH